MKSSPALKQITALLAKKPSYYRNKILRANKSFNFTKPVVIFGASKMAKVFLEQCAKNQIPVLALCDNDPLKNGKLLENHLILNPKTLKENFSNSIQIIVASISDDAITTQLTKLGFKKVWSYSYFFTIHSDRFDSLALTTNIEQILQNKKSILHASKVMEDEQSRIVILNTLLYRLTLNKKYLKAIEGKPDLVYFDKEVVPMTDNEVLVDGGAYDGDTLKLFVKAVKGRYSSVLCFEPDTVSLSALNAVVKKMKLKRIECMELGLGAKRETVGFTNEGNLQSAVKASGNIAIKMVPIDDYINRGITMIKVDIEGYEKQCLKGAAKTISRDKPKLAICAYHFQSDLWEIPQLIKSLNPSYKLYMRHYDSYLFETICYGV